MMGLNLFGASRARAYHDEKPFARKLQAVKALQNIVYKKIDVQLGHLQTTDGAKLIWGP